MSDWQRLRSALAARYEIEREAGRGGMATVYAARDLKHGRAVALKLLRPELAAVLGGDRFLREIRLTAALQHPHILPLLDSGDVDGLLYYVMPYVSGGSLKDRLAREGALPLDEVLRIARGVATALDHAHAAHVVHRDIKPENILLQDGEPLVADFGIALAVSSAGGERITQTGVSVGTPQYMSPEQAGADRDIDARSDVYSLGCVVYEMLAGEPPFDGPTAQAVISKTLTAPIPLLSTVRDVPPELDRALHCALAKHRADRFPSAGSFVDALSAASLARAGTRRLRRRVPMRVGAVIIGVVLALSAWLGPRLFAGPPGVAVLYFDNLSADSANAYLADGLTEEIIARLGDVRRLAVQSRAAVKRFRGPAGVDPAMIGRTLGVKYLVTGSVRPSGSGTSVRVVVELMSIASGTRVWGETYDRADTNLIRIEDDIAQSVAGGVVGRLAAAERVALTTRGTANPAAYDHYLRGNFYLSRRASEPEGRRALDEYQAALRLDPRYAAAYGRLGLVYGIYANWPWPYPGLSTDSLVRRGLDAADRALALDSSVVDGWLARGFLLIPRPSDADGWIAFQYDPNLLSGGLHLNCPPGIPQCTSDAVELLWRAVQLEPRDPEVWYQYGRALVVAARNQPLLRGRGDSATLRSLALDPDRAVSAWLLSLSYLRQRRWAEATRMADSSIALGRYDQSIFAIRMHARLGRMDTRGAQSDLDTIAALIARGSAGPSRFAKVYVATMRSVIAARRGDVATARRGVEEVTQLLARGARRTRNETLCLAATHLSAGHTAQAIDLLAALPGGNWGGIPDAVWDPIRDDPRLRHL